MISRLLPLALVLVLAGCDNVAALLADPKVAQRESDAKAIGGACRFGLRSIEDCYALNAKASKAAIFAGWKDMDQYMRENKVEGIPSKLDKEPAAAAAPAPIEEVIEAGKTTPAADAGTSTGKTGTGR